MSDNKNENELKKKKEFPHTFIILAFMLILASVATYLIPAGKYDVALDAATGKSMIIADSFHYIKSSSVGLFDMFLSIIEGMIEGAQIIFFIFIIGASLHVIVQTGVMDASIASMVRLTQKKPALSKVCIVLIMIVVSAWASTGTFSYEEMIAFVPIFVSLALALGYDTIVGLGMSLIAVGVGFTSATINPFTVGVAQGIAELPLGSGMGFRVIILVVMTLITIVYVLMYANKVKKDPSKSLVAGIEIGDLALNEERLATKFTVGRILSLVTLFVGILTIIIGVTRWGWYINEFGAVFLIVSILAGLFNKFSLNKLSDTFVVGLERAAMPAMVVGIARGILVVLNKGSILDTIINSFASLLSELGIYVSSLGMLLFQMLLNFLIPSGSAQAATSMPIMIPISDLIGINRQIAVLIFQLGDGLSNLLWPTGLILIFCSLAKVPVNKYYKFFLPLFGILFIAQVIFIFSAILIGYGPY